MKKGFTLAEVLITLGIIGIVAAMTLPALVGRYKKNVVETSLKKYYSILNQMLRRSEVDNGPAIYWEWEQTTDADAAAAFFDKYFLPYITVVENRSSYGGHLYYEVYSADGEGPLWDNNNIHNMPWRQLPDGGAIRLSLWGLQNVHYGTISMVLPTGAKRSHLVEGKDVFEFAINLSKDKSSISVFPNSYWNWSCDSVKENITGFVNKCKSVDNSGSGIYPSTFCAMLLYCNNWKIPDYYPVKF